MKGKTKNVFGLSQLGKPLTERGQEKVQAHILLARRHNNFLCARSGFWNLESELRKEKRLFPEAEYGCVQFLDISVVLSSEPSQFHQ